MKFVKEKRRTDIYYSIIRKQRISARKTNPYFFGFMGQTSRDSKEIKKVSDQKLRPTQII